MVSFFTAILGAARNFFGPYFVTALVEDWLRIVLEDLLPKY